jgi:hypothetical protein
MLAGVGGGRVGSGRVGHGGIGGFGAAAGSHATSQNSGHCRRHEDSPLSSIHNLMILLVLEFEKPAVPVIPATSLQQLEEAWDVLFREIFGTRILSLCRPV